MHFSEPTNSIIITGGLSLLKGANLYHDDVYLLDLEKLAWYQVTITNRELIPRAEQASLIMDNKLVLLGGKSNDLFIGMDFEEIYINPIYRKDKLETEEKVEARKPTVQHFRNRGQSVNLFRHNKL